MNNGVQILPQYSRRPRLLLPLQAYAATHPYRTNKAQLKMTERGVSV